ncbi:fucose mutarotase isoform X2 [Hyla sarda]|uniref:fucose mutarotase isoform X2 n=1 Tax=Hyla sarda TaxID=327740 RepID=UPI0024C35713|nr:fucose mutarotase isoform X2 [Hyla sarda]
MRVLTKSGISSLFLIDATTSDIELFSVLLHPTPNHQPLSLAVPLKNFLADANFPASSISRSGPELVRADEPTVHHSGLEIPRLLEAILQLLPLDTYIPRPAAVMDLVDSDKKKGLQTPVWDEYKTLLLKSGCEAPLEQVERFAFYERAKNAFAVVATGETALYGNLILKKGVISPNDLV